MKRRMDLVGEKRYLAELLPTLKQAPNFKNGFGHDASVVTFEQPVSEVIYKIDRAAQPVAVLRGWADYSMWGRLAVTANCSDILASGGTPRAFMVSVIVPRGFYAEDLTAVMRGIEEECSKRGVAFVGGDTKEGPHPELVGTAIGTVDGVASLGRSGARDGDLLVAAGSFGGYLGAYHLFEGEPLSPRSSAWLRYLTHPTAQWEAASLMSKHEVAHAATDCSDGLYDAVKSISGELGCVLDERLLPYHDFAVEAAHSLDIPILNMVMGVGDWNIVYAVSPKDMSTIPPKQELTIIGKVGSGADGRIMSVDAQGVSRDLTPAVNEHFVARQEDSFSTEQDIMRSPYV